MISISRVIGYFKDVVHFIVNVLVRAVKKLIVRVVNWQSFTFESQKNFDYKTNYKNHNWPKKKQGLQLKGKEKYNLKYILEMSNKNQLKKVPVSYMDTRICSVTHGLRLVTIKCPL